MSTFLRSGFSLLVLAEKKIKIQFRESYTPHPTNILIFAGDLVIFTTAEVVIGECKEAVFTRPHDHNTGFDELKVEMKV